MRPAVARALAAAVGCVLAGAPSRAAGPDGLAARLVQPWPALDGSHSHDGQIVSFPSSSPFTPFEAARRPGEPPTAATGLLVLPKGATATRTAPAAVLLHGSAGVLWAREVTYARQLAELGVAALVVDSFAARRERATGFIERLLEVTETMMVADAYGALRYLAGRPEIDTRRVALIGFSYGAMATVFAAYRQVAELFAPDGLRFAGHVAFYGPCIARFVDARATGAPVLMLWGTEDAIIDARRCGEIADDLRGGGATVETIAYAGAYHQWDGSAAGPRRIGRSLASCSFTVEADGLVRDTYSTLPMNGSFAG
jgi:dienelactone hydrolase